MSWQNNISKVGPEQHVVQQGLQDVAAALLRGFGHGEDVGQAGDQQLLDRLVPADRPKNFFVGGGEGRGTSSARTRRDASTESSVEGQRRAREREDEA